MNTALYYLLIFIVVVVLAYIFTYIAFRQGFTQYNPYSTVASLKKVFGGKKEKEDNTGMSFLKEKEIDEDTIIDGYAIIKKCKFKKNLHIKGTAEIKGCEIAGKLIIDGHADVLYTTAGELIGKGLINALALQTEYVSICGKIKIKNGKIGTLEYLGNTDKCPTGTNQPPFIKLKSTQVKSIKLPSGVDKATAIFEEK